MKMLWLSTTEWWELPAETDVDALQRAISQAIKDGTSVEVPVLINVNGSGLVNPWPAVLVLNGRAVATALVTAYELSVQPSIMPHHAPLG